MIAFAHEPSAELQATWQDEFLDLLPRIKRIARRAFRGLDGDARDDAITEVVASAMCAYQRLHERGATSQAFASTLAKYAIKQYRADRRVGSSQCVRDIYSQRPRKDADYKLWTIGTPGEQAGGWRESLTGNCRTSIANQVAFLIDFPAWLSVLTPRNRRLVKRLAMGHGTAEVAGHFRLSPARVSQLRRELARSWYAYVGDPRATQVLLHLVTFEAANPRHSSTSADRERTDASRGWSPAAGQLAAPRHRLRCRWSPCAHF